MTDQMSEPLLGWRTWRVMRHQELDGKTTYRLCAVGTLGLPKIWPPREPIAAVCSDFESKHAAPAFDHECGVWALKSEAEAQRALTRYNHGRSNADAWAIGRVSLWGRVIDCERGWRAQYAYPYAVTVIADDQSIARSIQNLYSIDVEWSAEHIMAAPPGDDDLLDEIEKDLEEAEQLLNDLAARARRLGVPTRVATTTTPKTSTFYVYLDALKESDRNDVLAAMLRAIARHAEDPDRAANEVSTWEVLWQYVFAKRNDDPSRSFIDHNGCGTVMGRFLRNMAEVGLVEVTGYTGHRQFRPTAAGAKRMRALAAHLAVDGKLRFAGWDTRPCPQREAVMDLDVALVLGRLREKHTDDAKWSGPTHVDPDILKSLAEATRAAGGAVPASQVLKALNDRPTPKLRREELSHRLVLLRLQGLVESGGRPPAQLWRPTRAGSRRASTL